MSYEVIQKVGQYQYIYLANGFRNEAGQVRQTRRAIGKIDPKSGRKIYKPEYLEELRQSGQQIDLPPTEKVFSLEDICKSTVRSFGQFQLYSSLSEKNGLTVALKQALPNHWAEVFMLACYMISTSDPLMYCADWISGTESYPVGSMSSQRITELLLSITDKQRNDFYRAWYAEIEEDEYLALDITSTSSYSELIEDVEWGYNRDHDPLPQINLCMLMGESSRLPIFQTVYSGSQKDVRTLIHTLDQFEAITRKRTITVVMDKGFYSTRNINHMLNDTRSGVVNFLISVPFTATFAKKQVESERKDIDSVENTIVINGNSMRAVTKERVWDKEHKLYTHIFYNAKKALGIREDLYATVALLRQKATDNPEKWIADEECQKYLVIRKSEKQDNGYTINIRNDVIEKRLQTAGWVVLISNCVTDAQRAMAVYRDKDVVEKGFLRLKNSIDLGRLRVHSDNAMQSKLFVGFIASVMMSSINKVMTEKALHQKYTMKELLQVLAKQRIQEINDQRIISPLTKEQRNIYEAFEITMPSLD
ncbi:MAG TPA: IS1634 family transposase [Acinetobacter lwoffii]|nr:IS1634 family transposase [Acinetobacter lwoffii]